MFGHRFGRHILDVAQQQREAFPIGENRQTIGQAVAAFRAQQYLLRAIAAVDRDRLRQVLEVGKLTRSARRRKSMAVLVAMRECQCAALSRSFN